MMVTLKTKQFLRITVLLFLFISQSIFSQKYFTRTGNTEFKASIDAFEPVEAKDNSTTVVLDTKNGDIAALLLIKAFKFKVALMQEHFNENYMDSDTYPKATFSGKLVNFNFSEINSEKNYTIKGKLTIKGISKDIETVGKLKKIDSKIFLSSSFTVSPEEFNIKIPSIVRKKIAKNVIINLNYELSEKK
ncbi:YceI family protein [Tenacibaculum crassostreae]|uniref:YceI family protein n=1 Tax=Tenacibaculum crassostreae TaxID=502683 RepID=UPI003894AF17